ncbi:MAG: alcohol dehydrogenase catalytic domain-containing protein [Myxococcota bacterium]
MRAIVVDRLMEPTELRLGEAPEPEFGPGALLVDVKAAGCNFFDILMCRGTYQVKPAFPFTPGAELAGVVLETAAWSPRSESSTTRHSPVT